MRTLLFGLVVLLGACGPELTSEEDTLDTTGADLSAAELKVATTGITLWLKPTFVKQNRDGRDFWILKGRTSVNLEGAMAFVPDDAFCTTTVLTARTFELQCDPRGEANTLMSGLPLFVSLRQTNGTNATAHFVVVPRFVDLKGASSIWVTEDLKPIYVANTGLMYRGKVSASGAVTATLNGVAAPLAKRSGTELNLDVTFDALMAGALGSGAVFTLGTETKTAGITLAVTQLELKRTDDAYATWPTPFSCSVQAQACLNASPTAADFEACGTYRQVSRCNIPSNLPKLGNSPDERSKIVNALATINAALPAERQVTSNGFYVENPYGGAKPSIAQVVQAWQKMEMTVTVSEGELTAGQVNTDLDVLKAKAIVPAIQGTVLQQSFKAVRLVSQTAKYELLYFSGAARVEVVRLPN